MNDNASYDDNAGHANAWLVLFLFFLFFLILVFLDTNEFMHDTSHEDPNDDDGCHVTHAINENASHAHAWLAFFFCALFCFFFF